MSYHLNKTKYGWPKLSPVFGSRLAVHNKESPGRNPLHLQYLTAYYMFFSWSDLFVRCPERRLLRTNFAWAENSLIYVTFSALHAFELKAHILVETTFQLNREPLIGNHFLINLSLALVAIMASPKWTKDQPEQPATKHEISDRNHET